VRWLWLVAALCGAASGCKRKPRDRESAGAAASRRAAEYEALTRRRVRVLMRVRFDSPAAAAVVSFLPGPFGKTLSRCKVDLGVEIGRFEAEVAGPQMFRIELTGSITRDKAECVMSEVLPSGVRPAIAARPGGGLVVTTPSMLMGDEATRTRLERRINEAPADSLFVMVVLSGERASIETLLVNNFATEMRVRYPEAAAARAGAARLSKGMELFSVKGVPVEARDREVVIGPVDFMTFVDMAQKTIITSVDVTRDDLPGLERGDSLFIVRGPYLDVAGLVAGDVVAFACPEDALKWCLEKVASADDGGLALPVAPDKVLAIGALVWWSESVAGVRWDRVWKLVN